MEDLQDRLIREMTIAQISSIDEANAFLPGFIERFNKRFSMEPKDPESAWVEFGEDTDIDYYISTCQSRIVRKDHTIAVDGRIYQLLHDERCIITSGKHVEVRVTPEGKTNIYSGKHRIAYREIQKEMRVSEKPVSSSKQPKPFDPKAAARRRAWLYHPNAA